MPTAFALRELGHDEFLGQLDALLEIYADAMAADPELLPGRRDLMRRHAGYPAFRAHIAGSGPAGPPVGFAYGFHGRTGQWWFDSVRAALTSSAGRAQASAWLSDSLEIAEVHVASRYQRHGIGGGLLLSLAAGRPERTALLSTPDTESTARRLYRRAGFTDLLTNFQFPGGSPPYVVMGATLPLRQLAGPRQRGYPDRATDMSRSASPSIW